MTPAVQLPNAKGLEPVVHDCLDLVRLFDSTFASEFNTRLVGGGMEPEYLPADENVSHARIVFTRDYFASALHEIAHWCVAGPQRRQLPDYGYWYAPDGRTAEQQAEFERVEVKPQALEWLFAEAAAFKFRVSADNLSQGLGPSLAFKQAIVAQAQTYLAEGLPHRASLFVDSLREFYGTALRAQRFSLQALS
jgi:elongation factor P hydroxylase